MIPTHDLLGVGIGPFNLSLAALLDPVDGVDAVFFDQADGFAWHPGLLVEGTTTQVPFLADLVTLADPTAATASSSTCAPTTGCTASTCANSSTCPGARRPLLPLGGRPAGRLPVRHPGRRAALAPRPRAVRGRADRGRLRADQPPPGPQPGPRGRLAPAVPAALAGAMGKDVFHAAEFLDHRERLRQAAAITVVGSGESGAEVSWSCSASSPAAATGWTG